MSPVETYTRGETAILTAYFTDKDNAAANPVPGSGDAVVVRIKHTDTADASREVEDEAASNEGTGAYYYAYDIYGAAPLGEWFYEVITSDGDGNDVSIDSGSFKVIPRVA